MPEGRGGLAAGLESSLIWASLEEPTRKLLEPPIVFLMYGEEDELRDRSRSAQSGKRTMKVICWEMKVARQIVKNIDRICRDPYVQRQIDQIILNVGIEKTSQPYFKVPVLPVPTKMLSPLSNYNFDQVPILKLSEAMRELEMYAQEGKAASLVAFSDGLLLAANSLNVRMSGIPLAQRMRVSTYQPWHLPDEFDRYVRELLRNGGTPQDYSYCSRKISDLAIYRYSVRARVVRIEGFEGELFRLSVEIRAPEPME